MVYLIASLLIHGIIFAYTGMTFIPHAQYSVQPSDQMVEVSIETISQNGPGPLSGPLSSRDQVRSTNDKHSLSGVKVKANPDYFQNPPPEYPELARQMRQEGLVMLAVDVDLDGMPVRVEIRKSSGFSLLDQAALKAVRRWKFQPGRIGDLPVESNVTVPIKFRLQE